MNSNIRANIVDKLYTFQFDRLCDEAQDFFNLNPELRTEDAAKEIVNRYNKLTVSLDNNPNLPDRMKNSWGYAFSEAYDPAIMTMTYALVDSAMKKTKKDNTEKNEMRTVGSNFRKLTDN